MSVFVHNFNTVEVQVLNCTTTSGVATFATSEGQKSDDVRIINNGPNDAWVLAVQSSSGTVKNIAGGVAGTKASYVKSGEDIVIGKGSCGYIAGICDAGTAQLIVHSGNGS